MTSRDPRFGLASRPNERKAVPTKIFELKTTLALTSSLLAVVALTFGCSLEDEVLGNDFAAFEGAGDVNDGGTDGTQTVGCDMTGTWIAEQRTLSQAIGVTAVGYSTYYFEIEDSGDEITVTRGWDCNFNVRGLVVVDVDRPGKIALSSLNRQDGTIDALSNPPVVVAPRTGVFRPVPGNDGECEFSMERWWWVRGMETSKLPDREDWSTTDIADIEASDPAPSKDDMTGQRDIDNDGQPGVRLEVSKPLTGTRDSNLRDWAEWGPFNVPRDSNQFEGVAAFNNQENILQASNSLLLLNGVPLPDGHTVRFVRIDEKAPLDPEQFILWCEENVDLFFEPTRPE